MGKKARRREWAYIQGRALIAGFDIKTGHERTMMDSVGSLSPNASPLPSEPKNVGQLGIRVKGKDVLVPSVQIQGQAVITSGKWLKIASIHDE